MYVICSTRPSGSLPSIIYGRLIKQATAHHEHINLSRGSRTKSCSINIRVDEPVDLLLNQLVADVIFSDIFKIKIKMMTFAPT